MREIKFRAFDPEDGEFYYFSLADIDSEGGVRKRNGADWAGVRFLVELEMVQQFTGRSDKNGKEIYEGDIVSWNGGTSIAVVKWDEDEIGFRPYINITTEVIGNIYENPELL